MTGLLPVPGSMCVLCVLLPSFLISCVRAGAYVFVNHIVYNVKYYKKAPRPSLCFCLREIKEGEPVWPDAEAKEVRACV